MRTKSDPPRTDGPSDATVAAVQIGRQSEPPNPRASKHANRGPAKRDRERDQRVPVWRTCGDQRCAAVGLMIAAGRFSFAERKGVAAAGMSGPRPYATLRRVQSSRRGIDRLEARRSPRQRRRSAVAGLELGLGRPRCLSVRPAGFHVAICSQGGGRWRN